uniref:Uncharacterized protein n=1 Tax=Arundo donax TaxID=35708 RepID=A0A0A9AWN1_ARUDO
MHGICVCNECKTWPRRCVMVWYVSGM